MENSKGVLKSCVCCARIDVRGQSKLRNVAQSLKRRRIDQGANTGREGDVLAKGKTDESVSPVQTRDLRNGVKWMWHGVTG